MHPARFRFLWLLLATMLPAPARADPVTEIAVWTRGEGDAATPRRDEIRVRLDAPPLEEIDRVDPQYGTRARYQGFRLEAVLAMYRVPPSADLALLHFTNGMVVPWPFRDAAARKRLDLFVALLRGAPGEPMSSSFPDVSTGQSAFSTRPTRFAGNKLVAAEAWHPDLAPGGDATSPWFHVASLTGVELVQAVAFRRQLETGHPGKRGREVFTQSCQFCHGVRRIGASMGPDLLEPVPLHRYRNTGDVFAHARVLGEQRAVRRMPIIPTLSPRDALDFLTWIRELAGRRLSYRP